MKYTKEILEEAVKKVSNYTQLLNYFNLLSDSKGCRRNFHRLISKYHIDISHFNRYNASNRLRPEKMDKENILVLDRFKKNRREPYRILKRAMLEYGIEYKCKKCGLNQWNNKDISLQIDHINSNPLDNRIENIRFLCPNCHSQTPNFGSRKLKNRCKICNKTILRKSKSCVKCNAKKRRNLTKIIWPSNEELGLLVWKYPMKQLSEKLGVTDNAIKKRCITRKIERPKQGYWLKSENK